MFSELFYKDPYIKEFEAAVVSCEKSKKGWEVVLTQTAFYPEGGGQSADKGCLVFGGEKAEVLDVRRKEDKICHLTNREIPVGSSVKGVIDWEQRFDNMQNHSGEHIFSGLVHITFGYDNVGFHMGAEFMQLDFNGPMSFDQMQEIEAAANRIIWSNVEIGELFPEKEELDEIDYRSKKELTGEVRLIDIPEADLCACCGTHVKRTGEIGLIKCLSLINNKGGVRIEAVAGRKALEMMGKIQAQNTEVSHLLSAKPLETAKAVERLMSENTSAKEAFVRGINMYLELKEKSLVPEEDMILDFEENLSPVQIRQFCDRLVKRGDTKICGVFSRKEDGEEGWNYCLGSESIDLRAASKDLNRELNGRGGGSPVMIQGMYLCGKEAICEALKKLVLK